MLTFVFCCDLKSAQANFEILFIQFDADALSAKIGGCIAS
jgi:hypothetical protein